MGWGLACVYKNVKHDQFSYFNTSKWSNFSNKVNINLNISRFSEALRPRHLKAYALSSSDDDDDEDDNSDNRLLTTKQQNSEVRQVTASLKVLLNISLVLIFTQ